MMIKHLFSKKINLTPGVTVATLHRGVTNEQGNIGEGDALVPLVDIIDIDCLHDVDPPSMIHASVTSSYDNFLPIYDEYDDSHFL